MKNFFVITLLAISLAGICLKTNAQKLTIYDQETKSPVSQVMVFDEDESTYSVSDKNGIVDLTLFPKKKSIWFKHPAYELRNLTTDQRNRKSIYLVPKMFTIDEFVVSASRSQESKKELPYFIQTITPRSVQYKNSSTSADILTSTGYVSVQKSQGGGGSPILRGFEANRVLLVIDGIRMNNAIYRSGHLQNSITIDPVILQNTEILFGPSSVIYGSDALGGVVSYMTKDPIYSSDDKIHTSSEVHLQYISASNSKKSNVNFNIGSKKWASLTSISYSDYGDIKMGGNRSNSPGGWGKMYHYAQRINGKDSMLINKNPNRQLFTGYKQYDLLQKISYQITPDHSILINTQYSTSSNISRFDQLNDYKNDHLKFSEYYYGPQQRLLLSLKNQYSKPNKFFNSLTSIIAFQQIEESRNSRKFNSSEKLKQVENIDVWSANFDFIKIFTDKSRVNYGAELLYNDLKSSANFKNIITNINSFAPTRYPQGGSYVHTYALYFNYHTRINSKLDLNGGFRLGYYHYKSKFSDDLLEPRIKDLDNRNTAPSGSIGLVYQANNGLNLSGVFNTGYRVPNVDDYGKIRAKNEEISYPNPHLKPEYAYNFELSATQSINDDLLLINLTLFQTWLNDAIVRTYETNYNTDSVLYDGDMYRIVSNANAQKAIIRGFSAGVNSQLHKNVSLQATINYTYGAISNTKEPMGHITPLFGKINTTYRNKKLRNEVYLNYQFTKKLQDMSPYGEDNEDEGTTDGFPGWYTINWASQYDFNRNIQIQFSVENILDMHYKTFASGISAPGRSFIISFSGRF